MHRVVIADDDMIVLMYLQTMVPWSKYGFEVIGTARDGEKALELVRAEQPGVLLTDVSMPNMSGIELISHLRKEGYAGVIDVLSCHDDFEMVRDAMKIGADDYMLKNNLNEQTTEKLLQKIADQVKDKSQKQEDKQRYDAFLKKGMETVRQELLEEIFTGHYLGDELKRKMEHAGLTGKYRQLFALIVQAEELDQEQLQAMLTMFTHRMKKEQVEVLLSKKKWFVFLVDASDLDEEGAASKIDNISRIQKKLVREYFDLEMPSVRSELFAGENAVVDALRQAGQLLQEEQSSFYSVGKGQSESDVRLPENLPYLIRDALKYIQKHFREPIGLSDVAGEVELSSAYFSTMFKREMGVGFSEYIVNLRLRSVCEELRSGRDAIKNISEKNGFADYSYFCKLFKKTYGVSPAVYRKENR